MATYEPREDIERPADRLRNPHYLLTASNYIDCRLYTRLKSADISNHETISAPAIALGTPFLYLDTRRWSIVSPSTYISLDIHRERGIYQRYPYT